MWGGSTANVAPPLSLLPARPLFHPGPAHPVFLLQSCWHGVNIAGWVSETCAPPHYPAPWGTGPSPTRHGSQTPSNTPLHPQTDQEVAFADSSHLPWHFPKPLPTHPPPLRRRRGERGLRQREPDPQPPTGACPGPSPRPAGPHAAYLEAGAAAAHLPAAYRKPNSGRWPSCRTLLCQRRSGRVAGAECATGQNGGMAFLGGGTRLIVWGGRAVCGLGRARCCTFGGERVSGNEVSCCIKDRGGRDSERHRENVKGGGKERARGREDSERRAGSQRGRTAQRETESV